MAAGTALEPDISRGSPTHRPPSGSRSAFLGIIILVHLLPLSESEARPGGGGPSSLDVIRSERASLVAGGLKAAVGVVPRTCGARLEAISILQSTILVSVFMETGSADFLIERRHGACDKGTSFPRVCVTATCTGSCCDALTGAIGSRATRDAGRIWSTPRPPWLEGIQGPWMIIASLCWIVLLVVLGIVLVGRVRNGHWDRLSASLVLFLSGFAVRLLVATWGPGALSPNLIGVMAHGSHDTYGVGPYPLLALLLSCFGGADRTLIITNLFLGALCPVVLHSLVRRLAGGGERVAVLAAMVLLFLPLPIRFAGEGNRQPLVLLLTLVALWGAARIEHRRVLLGLAATLAAAFLAFLTRPEAAMLLVPLGLMALVRFAWDGLRWPLVAVGIAFTGFATYLLLGPYDLTNTSGMHLAEQRIGLEHLRNVLDPTYQSWLDPRFTPGAFILLLMLGGIASMRARRADGLLALGILVFLGPLYSLLPSASDQGFSIENVRFQTLATIAVAILAAVGALVIIERLADVRPSRKALLAGIAAAFVAFTAGWSYRFVLGPTDADQEYGLLRQWVIELPAGAEIHFISGDMDISLRAPIALSRILDRRDVTWHAWTPDRGRSDKPRFLLYPAYCGHRKMPAVVGHELLDARCRNAMREADPVPFRFGWVTSRRFVDATPSDEWLPVGLYKLPNTADSAEPARR